MCTKWSATPSDEIEINLWSGTVDIRLDTLQDSPDDDEIKKTKVYILGYSNTGWFHLDINYSVSMCKIWKYFF